MLDRLPAHIHHKHNRIRFIYGTRYRRIMWLLLGVGDQIYRAHLNPRPHSFTE